MCSDREQIRVCLWMGLVLTSAGRLEEGNTKGLKEAVDGSSYVHYPHRGEGFAGTYMCQNSSDCTL